MLNSSNLLSRSQQIHEAEGQLITKYENKLQGLSKDNIKEVLDEIQKDAIVFCLIRFCQQAKQVSQIIAYIWRWIEDSSNNPAQNNAIELHNYFTHPSPHRDANNTKQILASVGEHLERLFSADPRKNLQEKPTYQYKKEAELLRAVFTDYQTNQDLIFPMMDKAELGIEYPGLGYILNVDINSYQGILEDTDKNYPDLFTHCIPYPPRPQLGKATVSQAELEEWIENREEDKYYAPNCYIPTTST
ncbi:MAG: hypothetical protein F6K41_04355 [Symploca sp. SIO3E6]|nr:hypothetical protein [Caldora sp. SIO3E6]